MWTVIIFSSLSTRYGVQWSVCCEEPLRSVKVCGPVNPKAMWLLQSLGKGKLDYGKSLKRTQIKMAHYVLSVKKQLMDHLNGSKLGINLPACENAKLKY